MANMKLTYVNGQAMTLKQLSDKYDVSYSTIKRYYANGLTGKKLLQKLTSKTEGFTYRNKVFKNKLAAAKYFNIPKSTLYQKTSN